MSATGNRNNKEKEQQIFQSEDHHILSVNTLKHSIFEIQINACDLSSPVDKSDHGAGYVAGHGPDSSPHEDGH